MDDQRRQIDRMVDGELSVEQQRVVLLACEENHEWRELALAYVEDQAWGHELRSLAQDSGSRWNNAVASQPNAGGRDREETARRTYVPTPWHPLSLAAAIFVSLTLGFGLGWWGQIDVDRLPSRVVATVDDLPPAPSSVAEQAQLPYSSMKITVSDLAANELKQIELPIVRASSLGDDWQSRLHNPVPESVINEMRGRGHEVTQQHWMIPIRLSSGQRVIVPVNYVNFEQGYGQYQ